MAPAAAASAWRALLRRHKLKRALTAWFWISCGRRRRVSEPLWCGGVDREKRTYCAETTAVGLAEERDEQVDRAGLLKRLERGGQHRQVLDRLEQDGEELGLEDVGGLDETCRAA